MNCDESVPKTQNFFLLNIRKKDEDIREIEGFLEKFDLGEYI